MCCDAKRKMRMRQAKRSFAGRAEARRRGAGGQQIAPERRLGQSVFMREKGIQKSIHMTVWML